MRVLGRLLCGLWVASLVGAAEPLPLRSQYAFTAHVTVGALMSLERGVYGQRRFIPITGGTANGPLFSGKVLPGSGDWQILRTDGVISLEARYTLESNDGVKIAVTNRGLRVASTAVTERMMRGDSVAPSEYYFRTAAEFDAPLGSRYEWLNKVILIGVAERRADAAVIHFYRLD